MPKPQMAGGVADALYGGGFPDPPRRSSSSARGLHRRNDSVTTKIGSADANAPGTDHGNVPSNRFADPMSLASSSSVGGILTGAPSVSQRIQDLREERMYRSRREEPLGRAPLRARQVPAACDPTVNPRFSGFGVPTAKDDTAAAVLAGQAEVTRARSVKAEAIESARAAVGVSTARIRQPGRRPKGTTFEGTDFDPDAMRFGDRSPRSPDTAAACLRFSGGGPSAETNIIPISVAQQRALADSGTGGTGVGMSPVQRLGREVFAAASERTGQTCNCRSGRSTSEAAQTSLSTARRAQSAGGLTTRRPTQRDSVASIFAAGAGSQRATPQARTHSRDTAPSLTETFGAPSVRGDSRPLEKLETPSVREERAFAANQFSARDLLFDRADPIRSQPALTAKRMSRDEMLALFRRAQERRGDGPFARLDFDAAWNASSGNGSTCSVANFMSACRKLDA
uniref:Uncharacterized protein n=1 Tax=Neobodo designis TaxID=312471 RepID=A0A7S1M4E7_NEODS